MFPEFLAPCPVAASAADARTPALLEELGDDALVADYGGPGVAAVAVDEPEFAGRGGDLGEFEGGGGDC